MATSIAKWVAASRFRVVVQFDRSGAQMIFLNATVPLNVVPRVYDPAS